MIAETIKAILAQAKAEIKEIDDALRQKCLIYSLPLSFSYLDGNSCDMKPTNEDEHECLSDEVIEKDIVKEKITGEHFSYLVQDAE